LKNYKKIRRMRKGLVKSSMLQKRYGMCRNATPRRGSGFGGHKPRSFEVGPIVDTNVGIPNYSIKNR
jgi:hypothetical protein